MEKQKITDAEKKKWKAMDLQELILWHNRFIQIIDGILEEHEWQRFSTSQDLPDHEAEKYAELYGEHKEKFLYYKERARYLGELLQLDPDAELIKYSPKTAHMVPRDIEVEVYEKMTAEQLHRNYRIFMKILTGIDAEIDYFKNGETYIDGPAKRWAKNMVKYDIELRFYFAERLKLIVNVIETNP